MERPPELYLAPMVRISTLPFRLLCLEYGAVKVFTPELVDKAIISSVERTDPHTGVISFHSSDTGGVVWSTHPFEKPNLILQLGTADPELAVQAFRRVRGYVSEINLNAGCPKRFSVQSGMGAALLKNPQLLVSILNRLGEECKASSSSQIPLSVKLRLVSFSLTLQEQELTQDDEGYIAEKSSELLQYLATNCKYLDYILVHSRRIFDRSDKTPAFWNVWDHLLANASLPLVANGDFLCPSKINSFWNMFGHHPKLKGLLIARGAQTNPSIFCPFSLTNPSKMIDIMQVCKEFAGLSAKYASSSFTHVKYTLLQMLPNPVQGYRAGRIVLHATNWDVLLSAFE